MKKEQEEKDAMDKAAETVEASEPTESPVEVPVDSPVEGPYENKTGRHDLMWALIGVVIILALVWLFTGMKQIEDTSQPVVVEEPTSVTTPVVTQTATPVMETLEVVEPVNSEI